MIFYRKDTTFSDNKYISYIFFLFHFSLFILSPVPIYFHHSVHPLIQLLIVGKQILYAICLLKA